MVRGLRHFQDFRDLLVHDTAADRAAAFAERHGGRVAGSVSEVAAASDVVLLATRSRRPLLGLAEARPSQHFTTLGVDEPGKQELGADLLAASVLVVDDHNPATATASWPGPREARGPPRTPRSASSCEAGAPAGQRDRGLRCTRRSVFPSRTWPSPGSPTGEPSSTTSAAGSICRRELRRRRSRRSGERPSVGRRRGSLSPRPTGRAGPDPESLRHGEGRTSEPVDSPATGSRSAHDRRRSSRAPVTQGRFTRRRESSPHGRARTSAVLRESRPRSASGDRASGVRCACGR